MHWLLWQVCPPEQALPQTPQLLESELVSTHAEPQSVCPELQVGPFPPVPLPPVPVALLPPVPELPPVCGLLQAAVRIAKPSPKSHARAGLVIATYIPGQTELVFRGANFSSTRSATNSTNTSRKWRLLSLLADARVMHGRVGDRLSYAFLNECARQCRVRRAHRWRRLSYSPATRVATLEGTPVADSGARASARGERKCKGRARAEL